LYAKYSQNATKNSHRLHFAMDDENMLRCWYSFRDLLCEITQISKWLSWHCNCEVLGMSQCGSQLLRKTHAMKFIKSLLAVAVLGAAFSAQAESNIASGAAANLTAAAKLNFRVTIPRVLYLRVGTGTDYVANTGVDTITFAPAAANVGTNVAVAGTSAPASPITVRVLSTGGAITLAATSATTGLVGGGGTIPWTQITGASNNTSLEVPTVGAPAANIAAVNGVVFQNATWSFNYLNANNYSAGNYDGVVTYTATLP
jgi:hypothetical protein